MSAAKRTTTIISQCCTNALGTFSGFAGDVRNRKVLQIEPRHGTVLNQDGSIGITENTAGGLMTYLISPTKDGSLIYDSANPNQLVIGGNRLIDMIYPIGSYIKTLSYVTANPSTWPGFENTTWTNFESDTWTKSWVRTPN